MSTALAAFRGLRLSISGGGPICWCLVLSRIGRPQFSAWVWPDVGDHRRSRHRISGFETRVGLRREIELERTGVGLANALVQSAPRNARSCALDSQGSRSTAGWLVRGAAMTA